MIQPAGRSPKHIPPNHKPLIMNWFAVKGSLSSAIVEALNKTACARVLKTAASLA
jgi:hypothetical protein